MTGQQPPKVIETKIVYAGRAFGVRDDLIELRGQRMRRQIMVHPGAAGALPFLADGRVVLVGHSGSGLE